jgi:predicted nucleic acid-binding protein
MVIDCSAAVAWCFEDEASDEIDALLPRIGDEGAVVPALWHLEVANVLIQATKRGRITADDADTRLRLIATLPITTDAETSTRAWHDTLALARVEGLTAYDAAYLELAIRRRLPLATRDKALAEAARRRGVQVLP